MVPATWVMGQSNTNFDISTDLSTFSRTIPGMNQERNRADNQRQHPRRASFIIVEYTVREGRFRDIMKNVGANGMFINTQRAIDEDQPVWLEFPLFEFDHLIKASGQVTRCTANGFAVAFDKPIPGLICKEGHLPEIVHEMDRMEDEETP
jgi:PilZ domain